MSRSYEQLTRADLERLGSIAMNDLEGLFDRRAETRHLYKDRLFAIALCQGAALHYLDGKTGIKDFGVWSFFRSNPERAFPYRRRGVSAFDDSKFGQSDDAPAFVGRRVDLMGRSIPDADQADSVEVLRRYLRAGATKSARRLAEKAVILIAPVNLIGTVVWPTKS